MKYFSSSAHINAMHYNPAMVDVEQIDQDILRKQVVFITLALNS